MKIYAKKIDLAARARFELSYQGFETDSSDTVARNRISRKLTDQDVDSLVNKLILKKYTSACVVVNGDLDIIQFRGSTELYWTPLPKSKSQCCKDGAPDPCI